MGIGKKVCSKDKEEHSVSHNIQMKARKLVKWMDLKDKMTRSVKKQFAKLLEIFKHAWVCLKLLWRPIRHRTPCFILEIAVLI